MAQLVARLVRIEKVRGSIPLSSTPKRSRHSPRVAAFVVNKGNTELSALIAIVVTDSPPVPNAAAAVMPTNASSADGVGGSSFVRKNVNGRPQNALTPPSYSRVRSPNESLPRSVSPRISALDSRSFAASISTRSR